MLRAPVREAEYAIDDWTPLRNFDCMIPQIKETRLFRIKPMSEFSMEDFKAQQKIKQLEWDLSKKAMPLLKAENVKQLAIIERQKEDLKLLDFWKELMESGVDTE